MSGLVSQCNYLALSYKKAGHTSIMNMFNSGLNNATQKAIQHQWT
jgi:hypothetical protein